MNRRRSLMLAAAGAPLTAALPVSSLAAVQRSAMPAAASFEALLGQSVEVAGRHYRLHAVRRSDSRQVRLEQFSVVLKGRARLPTGLYVLRHPTLGAVPLQFSASGLHQEALRADITRLT